MTLARFLAALRLLHGIDRDELVAAGAIEAADTAAWISFHVNPPRWLMHADDDRQQRVWALIERRRV